MSFQRFHDTWFERFRHLVHQQSQAHHGGALPVYHHLRQLVNKVTFHCVEYYRVKSLVVKQGMLSSSAVPWTTTLERSLHWKGGWRPTTAFHLLYTVSSILFESHVVDILRGYRTGDLGGLSPGQFRRVSGVRVCTKRMQSPMSSPCGRQDSGSDIVELCGDFDEKMERLARIFNTADVLRLKTIETAVELLTPQQAVEFLVAAADLYYGIHSCGVKQDRQRGHV